MVKSENWIDIGQIEDFSTTSLKRVTAMNRDLAVSLKDGKLGAVSNACNHVGGPLGDGRLDGDYIICPWHNWKFHRCTGVGEPGFEKDSVPAYPIKVENGRVFVNLSAGSRRHKTPHEPHPLSRKVERAPGALRLAGIFDIGYGRRKPTVFRLGPSPQSCIESCPRSRRRNADDKTERPKVPQL
jgi:nitrite reductase/ring-hydroxylating ferredoxin subunit